MFKIIKNGRVYSPDDLGQKDILIANDTIISVEDQGFDQPSFSGRNL